MIVSKFGGTSVGTYEAMRRSAQIVSSNPNRQLIVISAVAGITNHLIGLTRNGLNSADSDKELQLLKGRHLEIIEQCENQNDVLNDFNAMFERLKEHLDQVARDKKWKDKLYSFGELLSTTIFVHVLKEHGVNAEWLDARKIIRTDSTFANAIPDLQAIRKNSAKHIQNGKTYLTQGFIGSDIFGNTTTLGRGGSDFSAAIFAEAIQAETLEIWTDVAGVYTTDPRIVPEAFPIYEISFDEAAELSVFGGKVLHPATLKPALRANVAVRVASSSLPDEPGTYIVKEPVEKPVIRAITLRKTQTLLTVHSLEMLHQPGFLSQIFKVLADHKISVDLVSTSEVSVALTLDTAVNAANHVELTEQVLDELRKFAEIEVEQDLALIALIGNNLHSTSGIGGPLFTELEKFAIRLICYGASSNNLCFLVNENRAEEIVQRLHKRFIHK